MFFRYFTLFLLFIVNVTYSLKLKNKNVLKTNYNFLESNNFVNTPQLGTHCLFFINRPIYSYNRSYLHQKYKNNLNLKEDYLENENLYTIKPTESRTENIVQDSTHIIDNNRITHNTLDEYNNLNKSNATNQNEINELVDAALKWKNVKIPSPQPDVTDEEIESIREKFLRSLDDNEQTFGQIVRRAIEQKEAEVAKLKEKEPKEDWKEILEEFTIDVEGKKCYGCGANLQYKDEKKRGFVEPEHYQQFNKSNLIKCKRCSSLGSGTYFLSNTNNDIKNDKTKENKNENKDEYRNEYIGVSEREDILPEELLENKRNQRYLLEYQQKQVLDKEISEKKLFRKEDEIMKKIKEASTETVNIVRNMLKIKKRKRITILYIVDVIDPHIEVGLLELIKKRQEQSEEIQKEQEDEEEDNKEKENNKIENEKQNKNKRNKNENRPDGGIKLYLILNKIDLLPKYKKDEIIQYFRKMINSKVDVQLRSKNVFLISSKYNVNIHLLLSVILLEAKKLQNQILFIGPTNSGKSTLINAIHHILKTNSTKKNTKITNKNNNNIDVQDQNRSDIEISDGNQLITNMEEEKEDREKEEQERKEKENKELSLGKRVTSSIVPGTTLGVLGIKLGMGLKIYDTPGIFIPNSLLSYLDHDNLKKVIVNSIPPNKAIRLSKGHTLLIDKFARIDVTHGRDFFVKFYMSDKLGIFVKESHKLEKFINKQFGDQHLYYPRHYIEQTDDLDHLEYYDDNKKDDKEKEYKNNNNKIEDKEANKDKNKTKEKKNKENEEKNNNANYLNRKFEIVLEGWNSATCDLCIKGLGFMTIGGALKINFNLFTRKDVELYLRKPMFPRNVFPFKPRKN